MNLVEKLAARFLVEQASTGGAPRVVRVGDFVSIKPAHVMTHDNTSAVMSKFKSIGAKKINNPRQPVFALDHNVQDHSDENRKKYSDIKAFAKKHCIDFYPAGRGIGHQVMVEEGYAFPGTVMVASDSHSNMYGGVGCLGTPVVRTDAASIWVTGQTWWQVPPVAQVVLEGQLAPGVTGKDVIIALCGHFNKDEVLNHAVEFAGSGVSTLSIEDRLTIANMTTEWGALVGVFPVDELLLNWLKDRAYFLKHRGPSGVPSDPESAASNRTAYENPRINNTTIDRLLRELPQADQNARYAKVLKLDLGSVVPHVSGPNHVKVMTSVADLEAKEVKINKAYIVSCVNSRVKDLAEAAKVVRGKKVAPHVELYVAPASSEVQVESEKLGDWKDLIAAGAKPLPAGCGPCIGLGAGLLKKGEVGISATNRNFKGRMGDTDSLAYLGSPAVVAASAIAGRIVGPNFLESSSTPSRALKASMSAGPPPDPDMKDIPLEPLIAGFPKSIEANIVWCDEDNINTDGIYPGKYTYREDISKEEMARVAMENYDPKFSSIAQKGDILVSGFNFGTGSSREQAATSLKFLGLPVVLAGSYSATYQRNAFNNGFLALECPSLTNFLRRQFTDKTATRRVEKKARLDFEKWKLILDGKEFAVRPVGSTAQDLIVAGGLEPWIIRESKKAPAAV